MLTIHPLTVQGIEACAAALRPADIEEVTAAGISDLVQSTVDALPECSWAEQACWRGVPIAMFGVRTLAPGEIGIPWMLSTVALEDAERAAVARAAVRAVDRMRAEFDVLTNLVHASNEDAIRFVRWLGFAVLDRPIGPSGHFKLFIWRRDV